MQREGRHEEGKLVSVLQKFDFLFVGLRNGGAYFFVYLKRDFNVVKLWKIGKKTNVSAIYGRRVKKMERKKISVFALS